MVETQAETATVDAKPIADILREYADALRGTRGGIDVLAEQISLKAMADWFDHPTTFPGWLAARQTIGVCTAGGGHWSHYCSDDRGCGGEPS